MTMRLMKASRSLVAIFVFISGGWAVADQPPDRFPLVAPSSDRPRIELTFPDAPQVNASVVTPDDFLWDDLSDIPPDFAEAGVFRDLRARYVAYEPLNRDRLEIRVYTAEIEPARISTATGYAVLLASQWGPLNFGLRTHSRNWGEVMGGDDRSGEMIVNRFTVYRRGLHLLIVRSKFEAAHYDTYAETIATLVGSLQFREPAIADPIEAALRPGQVDPGLSHPSQPAPFAFALPGNWQVSAAGAFDAPGDAQFWIDRDDPNGNSAALVMALPSVAPPPEGGLLPIAPEDEQPLIENSANVANALLANALPDQEYTLVPKEMNANDAFADIAAFNRTFVYEVPLQDGPTVIVTILMTQTLDGVTLASASLAPPAMDLYLLGTQRHGDYVNALLLDAMETYSRRVAISLGRVAPEDAQ